VARMTQLSAFTPAEQTRLAIYKAAVAAGFYTDTLLERTPACPFTAEELARLMVYKAAIVAGFYTDLIGQVERGK
jgi:hypothetical protein